MKRHTRALTTLVMAGGLLALTGCGPSPAGTTTPYDPSDGVSASVGSIQARNLLIVGSDADQPGVVSGVLINDAQTPVTVNIATSDAAQVPVDVPAGGSVLLGSQSATAGSGEATTAVVQFASLSQPAGAVVPLSLSTTAGGTTTVQVPVLPPTLEYASITPTSAATATAP